MTAEQPPTSAPGSLVAHLAHRALAADFRRHHADPMERELLQASGVLDPLAQDYVAWRRAALWVAAVLLAVGVVIALIERKPADELLPAGFGQHNIEIIGGLLDFLLFVQVLVAAVAVAAAVTWCRISRSRTLARWAWLAALVLPLVVSAWPWSQSLDFTHLDGQGGLGQIAQSKLAKQQVGMALAALLVMTLAPKLLALFPGIIRSSLALKTLLPEATAPGWLAVLFAPIFAGFLLLVLCFLSQAQGSFMLIAAMVALIAVPVLLVRNARALVRPHAADEVDDVIGALRRRVALFQLVGVVLLVWYLFDIDELGWMTATHMTLEAAGSILLTMVAISDITTALLAFGHQQGAAFQGSALRTAYEQRLAALAQAGLTDVEGALGVHDLDKLRQAAQGGARQG